MTGGDHYRHSSSKGVNVNFVDVPLAFDESCADIKCHVSIGITSIEQCMDWTLYVLIL